MEASIGGVTHSISGTMTTITNRIRHIVKIGRTDDICPALELIDARFVAVLQEDDCPCPGEAAGAASPSPAMFDRFSRKGLGEMIKNWFSKATEKAMVQAAVVLIVPVTCSMAFAACSDLAGEAGPHPTVKLQSASVGGPQTGDNVTIGPTTYNSETTSFERPWPFGPEFNPQ